MALCLSGIPHNIKQSLVGKVIAIEKIHDLVVDCSYHKDGIIITVSTNVVSPLFYISNYNLDIRLSKNIPFIETLLIDRLQVGDIVSSNVHGEIRVLFQSQSQHNTIFFTESCNHNCIMCSQPSRKEENFHSLLNINEQIIPLLPKEPISLGITGGEPTLYWESFILYLKTLVEKRPEISLQILTNGRSFYSLQNVIEQSYIKSDNIMWGIPIYSDYFEIHDYIVGSKNAFNETLQGIYNMARYFMRIEIRIVIMKNNYKRLSKLARFIYKNLPFVEHIAFMGLEPIGNAANNYTDIWIDPNGYMSELEDAVTYLNLLGMNVSVYNLPLCCIPNSIKGNYRKSISDWKNIFLDKCQGCIEINDCGGFFSSAKDYEHFYLKPTYIIKEA